MRHDLPRRIQIHETKVKWYNKEPIKEAIEIVVLCVAFTAAMLIMQVLL